MKIIGTLTMQIRDSNGNLRTQWQPNKLWLFLQKHLRLDIRNKLTGYYSDTLILKNSMTNSGLARVISLLTNKSGNAVLAAAVGTGSPQANALGSEVMRVAVTPTQVTTTINNDTMRVEATFNFTNSYTLTEEGLFDSVSTGNMIAYKALVPNVVMFAGDSYILIHEVQAKN